jgi:flagellin
MGLSINQNIAAINSYRNLSNTQNDLSKSLEKLSSGFRINRAADDAAGLAISEGLRSQIGGLKVAGRNAQDGISVVQTAEGALTETHAILQRLRDLAVQGANDSNNDKARDNIQTEATSLMAELGRIAESTNFNGTKLLNGDVNGAGGTTLTFQVGADGDTASAITVDLANANVSQISADLTTGGKEIVRAFGTSEADALAAIVNAYGITADEAADLTDTSDVMAALEARGYASADLADNGGQWELTLETEAFSVASHNAAQATIAAIDAQIESVSTARAELGAYQNRFEHTIKNINVAVENLSASESRIRDTDMAQEMMNFTKNQILSQAGTAMLAQANQIPQGVLSLLR